MSILSLEQYAELEEHPRAGTLADARELKVRVESQLARQGDARAAAAITQQATDPCGPDQELRAAALNALMNMNAERAVPLLRQVLEDRDACSAELRQQAVFLIAQKLDEESVDILLDLAHRNPDPDPEVREQAVFWLSQVRSEEALEALEAILRESEDRNVQENALFAISQHRSERSGEILRHYAGREDVPTELRQNALFWIGQSPGGAEYLRSVFGGLDDPELKTNALHAIAQAGGEENRRWLVERARDPAEDNEVRTNALFWAGQSGAFSPTELRELFEAFTEPEMKEQLIFAAAQRNEPEAVDFLMEIAEDSENGELREQAIFWLGQSNDPRVPEFLMRIIGR
jgi:HEAT repeat protein